MPLKPCAACGGSGGWACPAQISRYNPMTHRTEWTACPQCGGSGRRRCANCNGNGKVRKN